MTEQLNKKIDKAGYPRQWWAPAKPGALRQGDLGIAYTHQLRARSDRPGPGLEETANAKIPFLGPHTDHDIEVGDANLTVRIWPSWVMVLDQTCELLRRDNADSRLWVAPVVFESLWPGPHWSLIRDRKLAGYIYLPPLSQEEIDRAGAKGWLSDTQAAVVVASATTITPKILTKTLFGTSDMFRHEVQTQLVLYHSIRDWKRGSQADELHGLRIADISETGETYEGPGRLFKIALDGAAEGDGDEITVGFIFQP